MAARRSQAVSTAPGPVTLTPLEKLAREAYIYALPMVENYYSIYQYAVDRDNSQFKAPFNRIGNVARVFAPEDTGVVTPNSDTPYSFMMADLRAEPLVVTLPPIEAGRYYSVQLIDLYTHNVGYLGTRVDGNGGGRFLLAGPSWNGDTPAGIRRVVRFDTSIACTLFRTQLFDAADLPNVVAIQRQYAVAPLSEYLGVNTRERVPETQWPAIDRRTSETDFWSYVSFLLPFAAPLPWETSLRASFRQLGLASGQEWPPAGFPETTARMMREVGEQTRKDIDAGVARLTSSKGLFGTPAQMRDKYWERALAAKGGLYGNDIEEAYYPIITTDAQGHRLDTSKHDYVMRFPGGRLPPVDAFWSMTLYDGATKLLVPNPLQRYLVNSSMAKQLRRTPEGDIVIYIQKESPGADLESNWLPAAAGPINLVMRLYLPKPEVLAGKWRAPVVDIRR
ncbi:DUF1254 domain-containing protein [Pandoraea capi]|nr:DUF1254 domain-containing protein [Pandoraea sp. LA3]MDN4584408.1 DUF1254 domain-containing protein [Pandoraea capi]